MRSQCISGYLLDFRRKSAPHFVRCLVKSTRIAISVPLLFMLLLPGVNAVCQSASTERQVMPQTTDPVAVKAHGTGAHVTESDRTPDTPQVMQDDPAKVAEK